MPPYQENPNFYREFNIHSLEAQLWQSARLQSPWRNDFFVRITLPRVREVYGILHGDERLGYGHIDIPGILKGIYFTPPDDTTVKRISELNHNVFKVNNDDVAMFHAMGLTINSLYDGQIRTKTKISRDSGYVYFALSIQRVTPADSVVEKWRYGPPFDDDQVPRRIISAVGFADVIEHTFGYSIDPFPPELIAGTDFAVDS